MCLGARETRVWALDTLSGCRVILSSCRAVRLCRAVGLSGLSGLSLDTLTLYARPHRVLDCRGVGLWGLSGLSGLSGHGMGERGWGLWQGRREGVIFGERKKGGKTAISPLSGFWPFPEVGPLKRNKIRGR